VGRRRQPLMDTEFASLLLDSGAVLALARDRPEAHAWISRARKAGIDPRVSLVTVAEVFRDRPPGARVQWVLSRLDLEQLTLRDCHDAGRLMGATGTGGKTIDALVAATALRLPRPVAVLTSDPSDLARLLDGQRRVIVAKV
jgi:predicted nucleic acid-binding protein